MARISLQAMRIAHTATLTGDQADRD